jgi:hypothetical protein
MGKKSRRARARQRARERLARQASVERVQPLKPTLEPKATMPPVEPSFSSAKVVRYQYVVPELRRIGIIAGVFFLILIVLAFILG